MAPPRSRILTKIVGAIIAVVTVLPSIAFGFLQVGSLGISRNIKQYAQVAAGTGTISHPQILGNSTPLMLMNHRNMGAPNTSVRHVFDGSKGVFGSAGAAIMGALVNPSNAVAKYVDPDDVGVIAKGELPPIWVPLVVGGLLFIGIALLQGSLGDVMDAEARVGQMSGARAAKQSARDRSMFKKK
ncbi:unnamed protein product [Choristocarpus tenellus]